MTTRREAARVTFTRWLSDGQTAIGIFENKDLTHPDLGRRVAFPFAASMSDTLAVGKTFAPDNPETGLGWRYILVQIATDADEALAAMGIEEAQDGPGEAQP